MLSDGVLHGADQHRLGAGDLCHSLSHDPSSAFSMSARMRPVSSDPEPLDQLLVAAVVRQRDERGKRVEPRSVAVGIGGDVDAVAALA
jgi:hypothetical protein